MVRCLSHFETISNSFDVSMEEDSSPRKFVVDGRNSSLCIDAGLGSDVAERSISSSGRLDSVSSLLSVDPDDQISLRQNATERGRNGDFLCC